MGTLRGDINRYSDPQEIRHVFLTLVESFLVVVYEVVNSSLGVDGWLFRGRDEDWDLLPLSKSNADRIHSFVMVFPVHDYQVFLRTAFWSFREKYENTLLIPQNFYRNSYIFPEDLAVMLSKKLGIPVNPDDYAVTGVVSMDTMKKD